MSNDRLNLTPEMHTDLVQAAARMVCDTVLGRLITPLPPELAGLSVTGTFVSLKRAGHLRSCCGGVHGEPVRLGQILSNAVEASAFEDRRFPPVSPSELPFLDLELWLLFNPQRVEAKGDDRIAAVITGGKHGLMVAAGNHRGVLLPGVAKDHGWDSKTFLEQVCVKAGLHPSLWREDATQLVTFEGIALDCPVMTATPESVDPFLSPETLERYQQFVRDNVRALLFGGTPRYSAPGLPDANISGLVLSFGWGGEAALQWSRLDLQKGIAFQASLFQMTQEAAQTLGPRGIGPDDLSQLSLAVLYDVAMHGTVARPDLRGIDPNRRAVLILERGRSGLVFDRNKNGEELLDDAIDQARIRVREQASIFSLEANVAADRLACAGGPRPVAGPSVRPPAVAGAFYPNDPTALQKMVADFLRDPEPKDWPAAMVPHAGLRFSGQLAGQVFRRLKIPDTVIILGPKHTPHGMDWAVAPCETWSLPTGTLASDPALARKLADSIPGLSVDALAHQQEHAIEVELPFLRELAPNAKVVGIAIGPASREDCRNFAKGLVKVLRELPERPMLLISSDMNHFATDAQTRELDRLALDAMKSLDPDRLYDTVTKNHISMCGVLPAVIAMDALRELNLLNRVEEVGYATSADVTGDASRVVGYAGMLLG